MKNQVRISKSNLIITVLFGLLVGFSLNAQKCRLIEGAGNAMKASILAEMNRTTMGASYKVNKRKTMVINKIESIHFEGCKVIAKANVTLKRKIRRNARGTVIIKADVDKYTKTRICLKNQKLDKIKLGSTLRVGEGFYKWIANKVIPNNVCYNR